MGKLTKGDTVSVEVKSLNKKGNGIGYLLDNDGKTSAIEIPYTIPGDQVDTWIRKKQKGIYLGTAESITKESPLRVEPRCVHFSACGGCRLQNTSYSYQLEFKESLIRKCFHELITDDVVFHSIIPCKNTWAYRNKMEFSFSSDTKGQKFLGLFMGNSRGKVADITECHLVNTWFLDVLANVRSWWNNSVLQAYHPPSNNGSLRTLTMREGKRTGDKMVILTVSGNPDYALSKKDLEGFVKSVCKALDSTGSKGQLSIFLRIQQVAKGMPTNFYEMLLYGAEYITEVLEVQINSEKPPVQLKFHISPTAFFQPNTEQAEKLYSVALQIADIQEGQVVYDLYCGTGTLGICAASLAKEVVGIEVSPESALDAKNNASLNNFNNVKIFSGAVRHVLSDCEIGETLPKPDLVVIDPPRPGLDPEALHGLVKLDAAKVMYISCNPETQAENVRQLLNSGYKLKAIQPVDQFAYTPHVENVVLLEKEVSDGNA